MKVIFCDWHHWTFPPNKHCLKQLLLEYGVECKDMKPAPVNASNSKLDIKTNHKPKESYRGFKIRSMIKAAVIRETKWYGHFPNIEKKYMAETMEYIDWAFKVFKEENPDYVVIEGGLTHFHRAIGEVARELGIGVIALENSFIRDKIFIEFNTHYVCNRHSFARTSQDWMDTRILTAKKKRSIQKIIKNLFSINTLKFPTVNKFDYTKLKYKNSIFIPLQVASDQVTVYDSKFNNQTFIQEVLKIVGKHFSDWNVIFKCHPVEEKSGIRRQTGDWLKKQKLPSNVHVLRGSKYSANTQDLIRHSDIVLVNNSQAGLEACLLEKPVVVFGDAFYSKKGFTIEYKPDLNWKAIKKHPTKYINIESVHTWFYYFYRWLFNKEFTERDKKRIIRRLNLCKK